MLSIPQKFTAALGAAAATVALAIPPGAVASPPPRLDRAMHWYHWNPSTRTLQGHASSRIGSVAVLGVTTMRQLAPLRSRYRFRIVREFPDLHAAEVQITDALLARAPRDRRVRYLSPLNGRHRLMAMPNDPLLRTDDPVTQLPYEWQFAATHVDQALDLSPGNPHILVGTIDTGAADVPDLAGKVDQRWEVSQNGKLTREVHPNDIIGHGTAIASLIAANVDDGFGMAGFGGATHLVVIHAWTLTDVATAAGLMKLDRLGVRIVNMSFGQDAPEQPIMLDAIHKAEADGMLLVAAAGNSSRAVAHPAADLQPASGLKSYGLAVGASDVRDNLAFFSNYGANLSLLAPGEGDGPCTGVLVAIAPVGTAFDGSCYPVWAGADGAQYAYASGTSFSAPEVSGVAALVWAARPELKNYQVAAILKASAHRDPATGWTPTTGCGVLDAAAALELATSPSSAERTAAIEPTSACSPVG